MDQTFVYDLQSKLEQATAALQRCDEHATAGRLALEVMHDIRSPIEALLNLNYLTMLSAESPDEVRRLGSLAGEQMVIVVEIANSVLGFAQVAAKPKPVNLTRLTEAALRIHQRTIEAKKVQLLKDLEDVVAPVYPSEILQVISNLVHNALDAVPPGGILRLRLKKIQNEVHLLIADNGHGIPAEHADEVFLPFFTTKRDRGTGLGLALSKKIIERHRGTIRMRSSIRPSKSGTLFKISLPL